MKKHTGRGRRSHGVRSGYVIRVTQSKVTGELTAASARRSGSDRAMYLKEVPDVPVHAEKNIGPKAIVYVWTVKSLDDLKYTKLNIISG